MSALLIYGDTERSAALRHEVPVAIGDPFLFVQTDGAAPLIVTNPLEHERIARALPDAELVLMNDLGYLDMIRKGMARPKAELVVVVRAVARVGVREFAVPPELPVVVADRLRADGVTLTVDGDLFEARRRAKSPAELEGIRRAQRAAEAAMAAAAAVLRAASPVDGRLVSRVDGSPVTSEQVRAAAREAAAAAGAPAPADIMVTSVSSSGGH
ncbi:MAG: Xaa-Pro aminopeptidase, partial [Thermoleophilaceae bacterium]|nr:Xaa-Pro aminopeptidase [Thermoleophilaceae bacterium]